uniref:Uncharacterized protein n=1 Tax=Arundo donax TaxID=35708 RepID=A0A0A9FLN4_ARUDO
MAQLLKVYPVTKPAVHWSNLISNAASVSHSGSTRQNWSGKKSWNREVPYYPLLVEEWR